MRGQQSLFRVSNEHGGELRRGKRKVARPVVTKKPMHLVLKAGAAKGKLSLLQKENSRFVNKELARLSKQFAVTVLQISNNGNHLHLAIKAATRGGFKAFLRAFTGNVARFVTKARKGKPFGKFSTQLAYT